MSLLLCLLANNASFGFSLDFQLHAVVHYHLVWSNSLPRILTGKEIDNFDLLFQQSVNKILQDQYFTVMTTSDATTITLTNRRIKYAVGCVPQALLK